MEAIPGSPRTATVRRSEEELHRELKDAVALLLRGVTEIGRRLLPGRIEVQSKIRSVGERPQRVVQEVVRVKPELDFHRLAYREVLEQPQIRVEVPRAIKRGQNRRTHVARRWRLETGAIDVLVG